MRRAAVPGARPAADHNDAGMGQLVATSSSVLAHWEDAGREGTVVVYGEGW